MYVLLLGSLLVVGVWLIATAHKRKLRVCFGSLLIAGVALLVALMTIWAEYLWYDALGYVGRFWTFTLTPVFVVAVGVVLAVIAPFILLRRSGPHLRRFAITLAAAGGVVWGLASWRQVLLYLNSEPAGLVEPMLGFDVSFYLFTLPLLDGLFGLGLFVAVVLLGVVLFLREDRFGVINFKAPYATSATPLLIPVASLLLAVVFAFGAALSVFHLLYSQLGVVMGPGWTDVYVRLPGLLVLGVILLIAGILPLSARFRRFMNHLVERRLPIGPPTLIAVLGAWTVIGGLWVVLVVAAPRLVQWLVVKPNEITFEIPYIERNIEFTRKAFKLDEIEERQFAAEAKLTSASADDNQHLLSEVR